MSASKGPAAPYPTEGNTPPLFLNVRPGQFVDISHTSEVMMSDKTTWPVGEVLFCEVGARDPKVNTMFQVSDVDTGLVSWVNSDQATHILPTSDGLCRNPKSIRLCAEALSALADYGKVSIRRSGISLNY